VEGLSGKEIGIDGASNEAPQSECKYFKCEQNSNIWYTSRSPKVFHEFPASLDTPITDLPLLFEMKCPLENRGWRNFLRVNERCIGKEKEEVEEAKMELIEILKVIKYERAKLKEERESKKSGWGSERSWGQRERYVKEELDRDFLQEKLREEEN
jgi:hypothetical protein